jgi:hypothetical protein
MTISPVSAAVAGALISGVAMYAVGGRAPKVDAFQQPAPVEYVQTVDGRYIAVTPAARPIPVAPSAQTFGYANALQPAGSMVPVAAAPLAAPAPVVVERLVERPAARQTAVRTAPAQTRVVERAPQGRSWKKTAMIIGGSSAAGAGVGGLIDGKKGALIGAAIGGGAASIYEATKR